MRVADLEHLLMINDRDIYDTTESDRDPIEAVLTGVHNAAVRLATEYMAAPPRRLDPAQEQALEDALADLAAVSRFVDSALRRSWTAKRR
jgi:hypothetical protein